MSNTIKLLLISASLILMGASARAENSAGELEFRDSSGQRKMALLLDTAISGKVNGMIASITVQQTFKNTTPEWVNGRYLFPLPENAAVDSLRIQIGERIIDGVIKEKVQAKKIFEDAKKAGKKAGLLEQHRPNLFSISVANIGPDEEVVAKITFIDKVHYENDVFSITLPTTLTPRYIPGAPIKMSKALEQSVSKALQPEAVEINTAGGWARNTDQVEDANAITPPQVYQLGAEPTHRFSLDLSVDAGLALQTIESRSHRIISRAGDQNTYDVGLANMTELMNKDLQLSWQAVAGGAPQAALFQQKFNDAYYSMVMLTPPQINAVVSLPRDITFIIDSSGSMSGDSMRQAIDALHEGLTHLSSSDRFNVVDFDSGYRPLFQKSQAVNAATLKQATRMINGLNADGGTEMMGALQFALRQSNDASYLRQLVFITDGAIGNEFELFKLIQSDLGDARLFTVGIGSAPNSFFMNKAAKFGRGSYTYIRNVNDVSEKMAGLFKKITHPVMRDIIVDWAQQVEQYPSRIPDLYAGEPLTLLVKSSQPIQAVNASGTLLDTPWKQTLSSKLSGAVPDKESSKNLDTVWARQKVADLMDKLATGEQSTEQVKPVIIDLGVTHNIVTKFTSLVAVEQTPSRPKNVKAKHKNVPKLMPQGSTMPVPQTATPAQLFMVIGGMLMLLSGVLKHRQRRKASREVLGE